MKKNILTGAAIVLSAITVTSCGGESKKETVKKTVPLTSVEIEEDDLFTNDEIDFIIPSPIALFTTFKEAGMTYHSDRPNAAENSEKYTTKSAQLINFGIYSADLTYNVINNQAQPTRDYFSALEELASKFGMGSIFTDEEIASDFEENIGNQEKLESLLFEIHDKSQEYLEDNDLKYLAAIQFSGAWIEGMYLGAVDFKGQDLKELSYKVQDQMSLLDNCIKGLETYPTQDEDITSFLNGLKSLQDTYNNFASVKATNGKGTPIVSEEEIDALKVKIEEIRNSLV